MNNVKVTTEMIEALALLRAVWHDDATQRALDTLDNAGIFHLIDTATDYDVDPEPEQVSKCTCPPENVKFGGHLYHCPGDPAEWGDTAYTTAPKRRQCPNQGCTGEFAVNKDGNLRAHTNDMCQPCK